MRLRLVCNQRINFADELAAEIRDYLPSLIDEVQVDRTDSFSGSLSPEEVKGKLLEVIEPDWKEDIVINLIDGYVSVGPRRIDNYAYPMDKFTRKSIPALAKIRSLPKGGHIVLGNFEEEELKSDLSFLAKLGVEQFHSRLGVLPHDEECFSSFTKIGPLEPEEYGSDFCPQCKEFLSSLEDPLRHKEISKLKREIYSVGIRDYWRFVRNH